MIKRIIIIWAIANFVIVGLASWIAGKWYLGWNIAVAYGMIIELALIILPNLIFSILACCLWFPSSYGIKVELGWHWQGWKSLLYGVLAFFLLYVLTSVVNNILGGGIPYNFPGDSGANGAIVINKPVDILKVIAILLGLLVFIMITVIGEETMFRGLIQTQVGKRYGEITGLLAAALLFGLRHLPNDFYYAQIWEATPQIWLSRQIQLYLGALVFGLARLFGKSTYASAITHGLFFLIVIFG